MAIKIIRQFDKAKGFDKLLSCRVVERLAWLNCGRPAKGFEQAIASATAKLFVASDQPFGTRIVRYSNQTLVKMFF